MKKFLITAILIVTTALSFAQLTRPVPLIDPMELPDSAFDVVVYLHGVDNYVVTGDYRNKQVRFRFSKMENLQFKDFKVGENSEVAMANCSGHSAKNVWIGYNTTWHSFPNEVRKENMRNPSSWWGSTNGAFAIGSKNGYKTNWHGNWWEYEKIVVDKNQLKRGLAPENYSSLPFIIRDSERNEVIGKLIGWKELPETDQVEISLHTNQNRNIKPGIGFWSVYDETQFQKGIVYDNFNANQHRFVSFYFGKDITIKNSSFVDGIKDYSIGFEQCADVSLTNVSASGNHAVQANAADVAFLFGIRGLKIKSSRIAATLVTSAGWEVSDVDSDSPIYFVDKFEDDFVTVKGWFKNVKVQGKTIFDKSGIIVK